MPQLPLPYALIGCFTACTLYALLLCTRRGQWLALYVTWLTVIIGCAIVLLFVALVSVEAAVLAVWFFVAGGAPIVVRSLWLTGSHLVAWLEYRTRKAGDE